METFGNDPKKAFTGKNALEKNPLYADKYQTIRVPEKVQTVEFETIYTIRKPVDPALNVDKVVDVKVRAILERRLKEYGGDPKKAFVNFWENPIWLNKEKGISIKRVSIRGINNAQSIHVKKDKNGNPIWDENGKQIPVDFVNTGNSIWHTDLNLSPLRLTMVMDYTNLAKEFNITAVLIILICAVCITGYIIFAYIISRYMVRPVEHLSHKMSSQSGHSLIQSTRYLNRTDEIGTLYNEYNAMVESLNAAVKQDYQDKLVLLDAQMKSLEARINSHFLFNTLEAINSIAELEDNETIATMSLALGNMFRYTLKTQSELVTVQDELGHVNDYVTIQRIRFDNRFHLDLDISSEYLDNKVLKLILQPLVENALYHGLNYCTTGDTITIRAYTENNCLMIDVHDNGQGMDIETLTKLQSSLMEEASFTELGHRNKQSIGLKNIHSRIELYYGKGYGLTVTSIHGEWTNIQIRLPILK